MLTIRPAVARGRTTLGWLDSWHTFSFGDYRDPDHMGYRTLRVINDDVVAPGKGFGMHPHRDMEIVTWILDGALAHKDDQGNGSVIRPGDVQRMSAGTGVFHSEWNGSETEPVRLLQIWILPERTGLPPGYEEKSIPPDELSGKLRVIASRDGRDGSVTIHQDAEIHAARLGPGQEVRHAPAPGRHVWVQVGRGRVDLNGEALAEGDAAAAAGETEIRIRATEDAEILLFDLA